MASSIAPSSESELSSQIPDGRVGFVGLPLVADLGVTLLALGNLLRAGVRTETPGVLVVLACACGLFAFDGEMRRRSGDEKISACSSGGATSGLLDRVESSSGLRVVVAGVVLLKSFCVR